MFDEIPGDDQGTADETVDEKEEFEVEIVELDNDPIVLQPKPY
ncbi:hypothetical protein [Nocardioides zeae]|nr:hypothetical protein [Nocardioides zeae]